MGIQSWRRSSARVHSPTLTTVDSITARTWFGDALVMYDRRARDARDLVAASSQLLALGVDGDAVVALASKVVTPLTSAFETDDLVADAREQLQMPTLDEGAATVRLTQVQLRRWERGELTDRQLTEWAHWTIGHDGPEELKELVVLDDILDEYPTRSMPIEVHRDLVRIAARIKSIPDPWA